MRDLESPALMKVKAALLLVAGGVAGALLLARDPSLETAFLLAVAIWAFCRAYYFLFYVLERYLGRESRYSGLWSAFWFAVRGRR